MVRARLPSIAKRLIQFECGADTTVQFSSVQFSSVQFRDAIAFPIRPLRGLDLGRPSESPGEALPLGG
jgi:hypothetical protein